MKTPLDKQVYAGFLEILKDKKFFYNSAVGYQYSHLTDDGKEAIVEFISIMAPHMLNNEELKLNERSKRLMMEELKS